MSRNAKLTAFMILLIPVALILVAFNYFIWSVFGTTETTLVMVKITVTWCALFVILNWIQLVFLRKVKTEDPVFDLLMPWTRANMWDLPSLYFDPPIDHWYRIFRVIAHLTWGLVTIGSVVFAYFQFR